MSEEVLVSVAEKVFEEEVIIEETSSAFDDEFQFIELMKYTLFTVFKS